MAGVQAPLTWEWTRSMPAHAVSVLFATAQELASSTSPSWAQDVERETWQKTGVTE